MEMLYLAMTAGEIQRAQAMPEKIAWMACHFSPYATGLSNLPASLPPGALLLLNDATPIRHHDPARVLQQLRQLEDQLAPGGIVLDFERPGQWEAEQLAGILVKELRCPVAVSEHYAGPLPCPVFLSAPPLHMPLGEYFAPWQGRPIWLEAAVTRQVFRVTGEGCCVQELPFDETAELPFSDQRLFCRYDFTVTPQEAVFTLQRTREELNTLLRAARDLGAEKAIGLYQQLDQALQRRKNRGIL